MEDQPDYYVDIDGVELPEQPAESVLGEGRGKRWIGVRFDCCGAYVRIYRNRRGDAYDGICPRCLRKVHVAIGEGGTDARFFHAE